MPRTMKIRASNYESGLEEGVLWAGAHPLFFASNHATVNEIVERYSNPPDQYVATINGVPVLEQTLVDIHEPANDISIVAVAPEKWAAAATS